MWKALRASATSYATSSVPCAWSGCSLLFWTLNPHDIHTPLLVMFIEDREEQLERISLGWDDAQMAQYYNRNRAGNTLRFHELAVDSPGAAAQCVHWTFEHTLTDLLSVTWTVHRRPL